MVKVLRIPIHFHLTYTHNPQPESGAAGHDLAAGCHRSDSDWSVQPRHSPRTANTGHSEPEVRQVEDTGYREQIEKVQHMYNHVYNHVYIYNHVYNHVYNHIDNQVNILKDL